MSARIDKVEKNPMTQDVYKKGTLLGVDCYSSEDGERYFTVEGMAELFGFETEEEFMKEMTSMCEKTGNLELLEQLKNPISLS